MKKISLLIIFFIISINPIFSQFGKNKVQYRKFDWKYISSTNFDIYFYDDSKYLAEFAARHGEAALKSIERTLNYKLNKRFALIIYNSQNEFQQTNVISSYLPEGVGGVTELFKNRVVVPFQGDYSQFRHVIHHELVHAVMNDLFYGGTLQSALSSNSLNEIPIWVSEGLAEWESIGGLDAQTDMFMRDVTLSENLVPLQYLNNYYAYRGGQSFFWYIADKYGEQRVGDFINRLYITGDIKNTFQSSFNMSLDDFSEQWQKDIKKYYFPDIDKFENPEDYAIRITNHKKERNFYNSSPAVSPSGTKLAFISDRDGLYGVFIQDLTKKEEPRKLVSSLRRTDFEELNILTPGISWNPDGTKLAISAKAGNEDAIFIVAAETGEYERILLGFSSISSVNWSPDGRLIAFIATNGISSDIYIYNLTTKKTENLTNDVFSDFLPVWDKNSKLIYFISDRENNLNISSNPYEVKMWKHNFDSRDIYSFNLETKKINRITFDPENNKTSLAVSPDGKKILYVSELNGIGNIYELDLSTGKSKPKTNSLNGITQLSLSATGNDLFFSSLTNGGYDIFQIKNPLNRKFDLDTLPLTKLKLSEIQRKSLMSNLNDNQNDSLSVNNNKDELIGYGNFEVEFDRQQFVKPNPDINENLTDSKTAITGLINDDQEFQVFDYKIKFSPDVIIGNPGFSTLYGYQGVAQILFSDVLGNHQIYVEANLWVDLKNSNILASYAYMPEVIDYYITGYHSSILSFGYNFNYIYRFRNYGIRLDAQYPFSLFDRIEWGLDWINLSKENVTDQSLPDVHRMLFMPKARYVYDDVLFGFMSPYQGSRFYVGFQGTPRFSDNGIGFMTITGDFRNYIPLFDYMTIATRFAGGASLGPNPQKFYLGGTDNWINRSFSNNSLPFDKPEDFLNEFVMPLRGFDVNTINGDKYFLTNVELRFPLFQALLAGPIPILFRNIMGAFFFDMGGAWYGDLSSFKSTTTDSQGNPIPNNLLMSAGIGVRTFLLGLPVKFDISWRNEYYSWSQPQYWFSLGYDW